MIHHIDLLRGGAGVDAVMDRGSIVRRNGTGALRLGVTGREASY
jgi:hypothetical protein